MNTEVHFSSSSNEWGTPIDLFEELDKEFSFQLDASATVENALCKNFYTKEDDALTKDWSKYGAIWCNPPYGTLIKKFVEKAYLEAQKGCIVVMLIPSRTDTKWWHAFCSKAEVRFIKGRLKFISAETEKKSLPAPFPSAIVVFKQANIPKTIYVEYL